MQHHVAHAHLSTHMATEHDNNHGTMTLRSATRESRNAKNYADMNNHSLQNAEEEPIAAETIQTAPTAHTRYLSSPAAATLHRKKSGFVLRLSPYMTPHATFMQQLHCDLRPENQERKELRRHEQPLVAKHRGGTDRGRNDPNRTRRTHEVPFIAGSSHFKHKVSCSGVPATTSPSQPSWCQLSQHPLFWAQSHTSNVMFTSHTTIHWV